VIRRDYLMRLAQEMAQVLIRVVSLKHRKDYDQALGEINEALRQLRQGESNAERESLEDWVGLCDKHHLSGASMIMAVADLIREQAEMFMLQNRPTESERSAELSLGLFLEALLNRGAFVSADLLEKIEQLIEQTEQTPLSGGVRRRLLQYFTERGRFARAEDMLFVWIETNDPTAYAEGRAFYERLLRLDDGELVRGDLPRTEVEEGLRELTRRAAN
jgi:tetratricopeptide (TPR) repeat protein